MSNSINVLSLCQGIWHHPANKNARLKALLKMARWQLRKKLSRRDGLIPYHGLEFICFADSHSSSAVIYYNGLPDFDEMQFMQTYLNPGDAYLDIGANIGTYSLFAASLVGRSGRVDAFEAGLQTADKLQQQITHNQLSQIRLHRAAVSDENGSVMFAATTDDCTAHIATNQSEQGNLNKIKSVRLDDHLNPETNYAMGKMDIEGAEILALKGATNRLAQANPPVWQLELAGYSNRYGYRSDQVLDFLKSFDFRCAIYDSAAKKVVFIEKPWQSGYQNILAIHDSANLP